MQIVYSGLLFQQYINKVNSLLITFSSGLGTFFASFKDSQSLVLFLKEKSVAPGETSVSFDVAALLSSIPVSIAFKIIDRKFTEHLEGQGLIIS